MKDALPTTPAIRVLRAAGAAFTAHAYKYEEHGGTAQAARELGIDEHNVVKTMHGDREISTKNLARALGEKSVELCERAEAERHSGYHCGGTSPFGFRRRVPIYVQKSILDLPWIVINGGQRGFFVRIAPALLRSILSAVPLDAEQAPDRP